MYKKFSVFFLLILIWVAIKAADFLTLIDWINYSFLVGILGLMVAACFVIIKTGFLSLFMNGFRIIGSYMTPKARAMEQVDEMIKEDENFQEFKKNITSKLAILSFQIGISSILISIIGLIVY